MAPNLALLIEVSDFKGTIKSTAKSSAGLRVDGERRKEKKYKRGGGQAPHNDNCVNCSGDKDSHSLADTHNVAEFDVDEWK